VTGSTRIKPAFEKIRDKSEIEGGGEVGKLEMKTAVLVEEEGFGLRFF
jgi:hypothetical protein